MKSLMPDCREVSALISRAEDEQLPWTERLRLRAHLWICSACRNFARQAAFLRRAATRLGARLTERPRTPDS